MGESIRLNIRMIAANNDTRAKGLMHSAPLKDKEIAFFIFAEDGCYAFWNKNVSYPLSLAFLDQNGEILEFADLDAEQENPETPNTGRVRYVIEARKGQFEDLGIEVGDTIDTLGYNKLTIKKK